MWGDLEDLPLEEREDDLYDDLGGPMPTTRYRVPGEWDDGPMWGQPTLEDVELA